MTVSELEQTFEAVVETSDTAQMFAMVIFRHTVRLHAAEATVNNLADMLLEFHALVDGDLTGTGLLLADLTPAPHTGEPISLDITRALLQCHSGTRCPFQSLLYCLKRFRDKQHAAERLARETLRGWLMDKEAFEVVPHIEFPWEDPDASNPSRSWAALLDFFHALQGNVTNWIRKMERNGMYTLAAHGEDLSQVGPEGAKASFRAERRLDLKLSKDAWKILSGREQEDWVTHLVTHGAQQLRRSNSPGMWGPMVTGTAEMKFGQSSPRGSLSSAFRIYGSHGN